MSNSNLRAILKPHNYRKDNDLFIKEKLMNYDNSPVIVYGNDMGSHIEYTSSTDKEDYSKKHEELRSPAIANIVAMDMDYTIEEINGEQFFSLNRHEYACEKILDKEFLKEVQSLLKANNIVVGIPFQGAFMAVNESTELAKRFGGFIQQRYDNPEADPLTPHVYKITDGELIGAGGADIQTSHSFLMSRSEDGHFIATMDIPEVEKYAEEVKLAFQMLMLEATKSKDFNGVIQINQLNESFTFGPELLARCKSFVNQVEQNEMAQVVVGASNGNKGLKVEFLHKGGILDLSGIEPAAKFGAIEALPREEMEEKSLPNEKVIEDSSAVQSHEEEAVRFSTPAEQELQPKKPWWRFW